MESLQEQKYHEATAGLYPLVRVGCFISILYCIIYVADLLIPYVKVSEKLVDKSVYYSHSRWDRNPTGYFWQTENLNFSVERAWYNAFRFGYRANITRTQIFHKVFQIEYDLDGKPLEWKRSRVYYSVLILPFLVFFYSFLSLKYKVYSSLIY